MDYKEKYEQALMIAKKTYDKQPMYRDWLESMFPEFAESEDEKIRKEILSFCQNRADNYPNDPKYANIGKWISWLEKQGEQKLQIEKLPSEMISAEESLGISSEEYNKIVDDCIFGDDKVKPKFKIGDKIKTANEEPLTITKIDDKGYWSEDLFICDFYDATKWELVEQKPAWSEEEEVKINRIVACLENLNVADNDILLKDVEWLKSLKGRVQPKQEWSEEDEPQKELAEAYLAVFDKKFPILPTLKGKQLADYKNFLNKCQQIFGLKYWGIRPLQAKLFEKLSLLWAAWGAEHLQGLGQTDGDMDDEKQDWSEEDEKHIDTILSHFEKYIEGKTQWVELFWNKEITWLKSLKDRVQPQNKWKPSEEQMRALQAMVNDPNNASSESCQIVLKDILEKLKKLKEGKV